MKKILLIFIFLIVLGSLYFVFFSYSKEGNIKVINENDELEIIPEIEKFNESVLYGKWQNVDDSSFVRIFEGDNTFKDTYGDQIFTSSGIWFVYRAAELPSNFPYPIENDKDYLIMNDTNLSLHFIISEITKDSLTLIYLDSGGTLRFNRLE